MCVVQISPNIFVFVAEPGFKGSLPSLFCCIKKNYYTLVYLGRGFIFAPLSPVELEIMALSWAIPDVSTDLIFALA